ncbi:MAG: glutathione S-transferase family protein [Rubellimicrobium sp.]|nr:glutathione S-transferase family protein [Rubellimicrobium sp.]
MKLIMSPLSPYARKVRVLIREAGQGEEIEEVAVSTSALATDPQVKASHPTGRIPVLLREGARPLHDSRVITRYLDELWGAGLYPSDRLWEVLTLEATAEGVVDSALVMAYEMRLRPAELQWQDWLDAHWAKIANALDQLEHEAGSLLAQPIDMGQIALGVALGYLDLRFAARDWRRDRPHLDEWFDTFGARASMVATRPA